MVSNTLRYWFSGSLTGSFPSKDNALAKPPCTTAPTTAQVYDPITTSATSG